MSELKYEVTPTRAREQIQKGIASPGTEDFARALRTSARYSDDTEFTADVARALKIAHEDNDYWSISEALIVFRATRGHWPEGAEQLAAQIKVESEGTRSSFDELSEMLASHPNPSEQGERL